MIFLAVFKLEQNGNTEAGGNNNRRPNGHDFGEITVKAECIDNLRHKINNKAGNNTADNQVKNTSASGVGS